MIKILLHKIITLSVVLLCMVQQTKAQFEEGIEMPPIFGLPALTGTELQNTNPLPTNTTSYTSQGEASAKIINIITLKIKEGGSIFFKTNFTASATLAVQLKDANNTITNETITLNIEYNNTEGIKYKVRDYKTYKDYKEVKVTVNSITVAGHTGWDPYQVIEVENEMRIIRYYTLSTNTSDLTPTISTLQPTQDVLDISWTFPSSAHENMSQIEWAYVETEMAGFYNNNFELIFSSNSTRVDIEHQSTYNFKIPLLFPGPGKLYFRTRAVQRKGNGTLISGPWSSVSETQHSFAFNGHEDSLNWQSSTTFAEGGKYKSVIQYFDGSLRSRQTVTKDNSTGNTIVGETLYDLQGRPNIQILPTPTIDNTIKFFRDFNRFTNMQPTDDPAKFFDLTPAALKCNPSPALDIYYGNGKYYSSRNPWLYTEAKSKFIPNAQGYAYTETRFTDDATQRVKLQGGVGLDHQLNSGHETKYFYGKPSQPELDALFGTEAGDASHYSKNMVQDANGQMSVSYIDMHGRTIATALAGNPTPGIDSIINTTDYPLANGLVKNALSTPSTNIIQENSIISVSTILVPVANNYKFTYQLTPEILELLNCNNQPVCFDCKYDLEISIQKEDCDPNFQTIVKRYNNLQPVAANLACGTAMGFTGEGITVPTNVIIDTLTLLTGSYVVRKTLTINDSLFKVRRAIALEELLCRTRQQIYDSVYNVLVTTSGCDNLTQQASCDSCLTSLGTYTQYKDKYAASIYPQEVNDAMTRLQYSNDSTECVIACGTGFNPGFSTLKGYRAQMLADMTPFTGQYANAVPLLLVSDPYYETITAKYNIFNDFYKDGGVTVSRPKMYLNPLHENGQLHYYDEAGNISDPGNVGQEVFAGEFQPSWANSLIIYHPEYSKLNYAETNMEGAYNWLDNMQNCTSYQTALTNGYTVPVKISTSTINDPYFLLANTNADKIALDQKLYTGIRSDVTSPSIWQIANSMVLCKTETDANKMECMMGTTQDGLDPRITAAADKDKVWEQFRTLYLSYRNEMVLKYIHTATNVLSQTDMDRLTGEGRQLIFATAKDVANQNGWSWWEGITNEVETDTSGLGVYIAANNFNNCTGQRPFWKARLEQCEQIKTLLENNLSTDSAIVNTMISTILDSLVMICNNSVSPNRPYGSTTVNPAYQGQPRKFEDVINNVFNANGINTIPGNNYFCNPFSVDFPKPYGLTPPLSVNYSNTLDSCACDRFAILKTEASDSGFNSNSFTSMNLFLNTVYKDSLTLIVWNGLQQCNNIMVDTCNYSLSEQNNNIENTPCADCILNVYNRSDYGQPAQYIAKCEINFLPGFESTVDDNFETFINPEAPDCADTCLVYQPIKLPDFVPIPSFLECGYVKPCISCTTLVNVLTPEFRLLYPSYSGVPFLSSETTEEQAKQNALWARFLNFRTGFSKNAMDYMAAYTNCTSGNPPVTALCASGRALNDPEDIYPRTPDTCKSVRTQAEFLSYIIYEKRKDSLIANFDSLYKAKCLNAKYTEQFFVEYVPKEYHYTLYYYDQAGNLVKTIPPAAVKPDYTSGYLANVASARNAGTDYAAANNEGLATQYRYNSLNQVTVQKTPDAGISKFWYDKLGRLVVSQNAKQITENTYSYTLYDELGRITQVGQKPQTTAMTQAISQDVIALQNWLSVNGLKEQITRTVYDVAYYAGEEPATLEPLLFQRNLRNRVSYTQVIGEEPSNGNYAGLQSAATYYSYDIHGNVDTLVQDLKDAMASTNNRYKKMVYGYDLISGKVNKVNYQPGWTDQLYHKYSYDGENRIESVSISNDSIYWETDAVYNYYRHGPLSRTVLGQNRVQGVDYAYTIQGWLKGVNSSSIAATGNSGYDMGEDGIANQISESGVTAKDAFGFSLNYFNGDYIPIQAVTPFVNITVTPASLPDGIQTGRNLFNGNIRAMLVNIPKAGNPLLYAYRYDQLNRIKAMNSYTGFTNGSNSFTNNNVPSASDDYKERITYDPNGNIKTYVRNGAASQTGGITMDNLTYGYNITSGNLQNNKLRHVKDAIGNTNYAEDLDDQADDNYTYDAIGNLTADVKEGISNITWNVYGKIASITKTGGSINYSYDASGNRISKTANGKKTVYVRDASGNVMSVYVTDGAINDGALTQTESHLYGSSRLGVWNVNRNVSGISTIDYSGFTNNFVRGNKLFELNNHLGNVMVTVSDKLIGVDDGVYGISCPSCPPPPEGEESYCPCSTLHSVTTPDGQLDYYIADVITANDYYPFGMQMPGRKYAQANSGYRYGFNGKENDNDVKGEGNQQDYGMRIYDTRLGKFLSVDLLTRKYAMLSPFQYASNRPIDGIDLDGLEFLPYRKSMYQLQYSINTSTQTLGSGKQQTVTNQNVVVGTVYANIPTSLQDSKTNSFKYVSGGPVTAWGRDWDINKDGAIVVQEGKYYITGPKFYGLDDGGQDPEPTSSTKGMGGRAVNQARNRAANAGGSALGEEGAGVIANQFNKSIWNGLGQENQLRKGFYSATNMVDHYKKNNLLGEKSLLNSSGRSSLINFLTDGSLNTSFADNLNDQWNGNIHYDFSPMRKNGYGNALKVAYEGLQIMQGQNVPIRSATISAIKETIQKYKANGGGTEYDDFTKFTNTKK